MLICGPLALSQEELPEAKAATAFTKFGRGVGNVIKAPFEIPMSMTYIAKNTDAFVGVVTGLFAGVVAGFERGFVGAFEVVTFPFPPYDQPLLEHKLGESALSESVIGTFPPNWQ